MVLWTLFILFFWIVLETAQRVRNLEERFFASLFGILFLFQVGINVGMNLGIAPVTGIPLPFVSYGGSSLLVHLAGAGMIARLIWRTEQEERERWI
jgi:rod shape determining protein RodA